MALFPGRDPPCSRASKYSCGSRYGVHPAATLWYALAGKVPLVICNVRSPGETKTNEEVSAVCVGA